MGLEACETKFWFFDQIKDVNIWKGISKVIQGIIPWNTYTHIFTLNEMWFISQSNHCNGFLRDSSDFWPKELKYRRFKTILDMFYRS